MTMQWRSFVQHDEAFRVWGEDPHRPVFENWSHHAGVAIAATAVYPRGYSNETRLFDVWCPSLAPDKRTAGLYRAALRLAKRCNDPAERGRMQAAAWGTMRSQYLAQLATRGSTRVVEYPVEGPRNDYFARWNPLVWLLDEESVGAGYPTNTLNGIKWELGKLTLLTYDDGTDPSTPHSHLEILLDVIAYLREQVGPAPAYDRLSTEDVVGHTSAYLHQVNVLAPAQRAPVSA